MDPKDQVHVNDVIVRTDGAVQTISVFVLSFLTFNLRHPKTQEATLEALEGLLGIRRSFSRQSAKNLLLEMNII